MLWSSDYLPPAWKVWMSPVIATGEPVDEAAVARAKDDIAAHLDVLEARLGGRRWLVGDYSLADVCYAPIVTVLDRVSLGDLLESRPAVRAWVQRLEERPAVRETAPPPGPGR
jgi:glutathione S-transferase